MSFKWPFLIDSDSQSYGRKFMNKSKYFNANCKLALTPIVARFL